MHMLFGCGVKSPCTRVHEENLILRATHEVMDEKPRRSGMKRECAKTGAIQRQKVRTRSLGISQVPFLNRFLKWSIGPERSTFDFHD